MNFSGLKNCKPINVRMPQILQIADCKKQKANLLYKYGKKQIANLLYKYGKLQICSTKLHQTAYQIEITHIF